MATTQQKYLRWDDDQLQYTKILPEEVGSEYSYKMLNIADFQALKVYIQVSISSLAPRTKELAIHATCGTNNAGMNLYVALAEPNGTGTPSVYSLLNKVGNNKNAKSGNFTKILVKILKILKIVRFSLFFVGYETDKSKINAIKEA